MTRTTWHDPPEHVDLPPATVDVWRAVVSGRAEARTILRALLARYLRAEPEAIEFAIGPHGKPDLVTSRAHASPLQFNMSHTRDLALYAVARELSVGVDVERPRPGLDTVRLARRFITAPEADRIAGLAAPDRDAAFLGAWVRHEATVKCLGTGIGAADLAALPAGAMPWVDELDPGDGAAAAVAAAAAPDAIRLWQWRSRRTAEGQNPADS